MDATRLEVWVAWISVLVCSLLFSRIVTTAGLVWFLTFVALMGFAQAGGLLISRGSPRVHQRAFRRAWSISVLYWALPIIAAHIGFAIITELWIDYQFWMYSQRRWMLITAGVDVLAAALALPLWYRSWRRTSRLAGVPEGMRTGAKFRRGIFLASLPLLPVAVIFFIGLVLYSAMALLDRFFPGWELGR